MVQEHGPCRGRETAFTVMRRTPEGRLEGRPRRGRAALLRLRRTGASVRRLPAKRFLFFLVAALGAVQPATAGPTLAVEDTLHTEVPEVLVRAPRVTLEEILDRVSRGEARRESLLTDQSFRVAIRMMRDVTRDTPRLVEETVWRVYRKRPDKVRSILLRRTEAPRKKRGARSEINVDFSPGMGEEIVNFAFRPEARRQFRYHLVGRDLVGGHVIYRLAFEPRSLLSALEPSGLVWIDTNDFVIVREEVFFRQSPVPLVLRQLHRMVIERTRVGESWVLSRVLMRVEMTVPFPSIGRSLDMTMRWDDYTLNTGLPDSLFVDARGR